MHLESSWYEAPKRGVLSPIPVKVYITIFEFLAPSRYFRMRERRKTLCRLSLTCRLFCALSQPIIFRCSLKLIDGGPKSFLVAVFDKDRSAHSLCPLIYHITVAIPRSKYPEPPLQSLPLLTNLTSMTLSEMTIPRKLVESISSMGSIVALRFLKCAFHDDVKTPDFNRFSSLLLEEIEYLEPEHSHGGRLRAGFAESIITSKLRMFSSDNPKFGCIMMLHKSAPQLTHLRLGCVRHLRTLSDFLNRTPSITHLSLLDIQGEIANLDPKALPKLSVLEGDKTLRTVFLRNTVASLRLLGYTPFMAKKVEYLLRGRVELRIASTLLETLPENGPDFPRLERLCIEFHPQPPREKHLAREIKKLTRLRCSELKELELILETQTPQQSMELPELNIITEILQPVFPHLEYIAFSTLGFWSRKPNWSTNWTLVMNQRPEKTREGHIWRWGVLHPQP
ncbi:hypothetical protein C8J56DRAFT_964482 [Mycena floridula]|nr:hypothetical protein C8J56DRAFT_964482 [Mycena floridula]